jgi:hypothetical protein
MFVTFQLKEISIYLSIYLPVYLSVCLSVHNPERGILHSHRCENLKSYAKINVLITCLFISVYLTTLPTHMIIFE